MYSGNVFHTNKISVRSIIHRVPIPSHIGSPVCPTFMVFTGKNKIPRKNKTNNKKKNICWHWKKRPCKPIKKFTWIF